MTRRETIDGIINAIRRSDADGYASHFMEEAVLEYPLAPQPIQGRAAIREGEQALFDAFSDVDVDVLSMTSEEDRVAVEVVVRATNTGSIDLGSGDPLPATGRRIKLSAAWIFEFDPTGLVRSERDYFDTGDFIGQLGINRAAS